MNGSSSPLNSSNWEEPLDTFLESQYEFGKWRSQLLIAVYLPLFLVALISNSLLIFVVLKYHYMRSVTNYFLVNLSVADLLVTLICMPMAVARNVTTLWLFGEPMCKFSSYLQGVSVGVSVFTLSAMSLDRYMAIRRSMAFRRVILNQATLPPVLVCLWSVPMLVFLPVLAVRKTISIELDDILGVKTGHVWCIEQWDDFLNATSYNFKHAYGLICFGLMYGGPVLVVSVAYALMGRDLWKTLPPFDRNASLQQVRVVRERRRVARLLLLLASLFTLCWLPYNILTLILDMDWVLPGDDQDSLMEVYPWALVLGHANSAINPLLYCFMTRKLRKTLGALVCRGESREPRKHNCKRCSRLEGKSITSSSGGNSIESNRHSCMALTSLKRLSSREKKLI